MQKMAFQGVCVLVLRAADVCTYACVYTHRCVLYLCMCVPLAVCVHVHMCAHASLCACKCVYACICTCIPGIMFPPPRQERVSFCPDLGDLGLQQRDDTGKSGIVFPYKFVGKTM